MQQLSAFVMKKRNWLVRLLVLVLPVIVLLMTLSQPAFAQITYVITDGDQVKVHTSSTSDPEMVLHEAGVLLDEEDIFTTSDGEEGPEINVERGQVVTLTYQGREMEVYSYTETVGELMDRLNLEGEPLVAEDTPTYDGMEVHIPWNVEQVLEYTVEIPYGTIYCDDPNLAVGTEYVASAGKAGQALCTDKVSYRDGVEVARESVSYEVLQEVKYEVVVRGTGETTAEPSDYPIIGDGVIILPTGEVLTYTHSDVYKATAYTSWIEDVGDMTATGTQARVGAIAVDPKLIPYGTRMFIVTNDGEYVYGIATAEDCGGGVRGKHVDLFFNTVDECWQFGVRQCTIYFLGDANWRGDTNWKK